MSFILDYEKKNYILIIKILIINNKTTSTKVTPCFYLCQQLSSQDSSVEAAVLRESLGDLILKTTQRGNEDPCQGLWYDPAGHLNPIRHSAISLIKKAAQYDTFATTECAVL